MANALQLHPTSRCGAAIAVSVDARRPAADRLSLAYRITGEVARLHVPAASEPLRTGGLWKRTCFEAFLQPGGGDAYVEFNFAPSGCWATYRFDRCRQGMRDATDVVPGPIAFDAGADRLDLDVSATLPEDMAAAPVWRLGLAAVIEEADGTVSHWALTHPSAQPDFHNAAAFAHELRA